MKRLAAVLLFFVFCFIPCAVLAQDGDEDMNRLMSKIQSDLLNKVEDLRAAKIMALASIHEQGCPEQPKPAGKHRLELPDEKLRRLYAELEILEYDTCLYWEKVLELTTFAIPYYREEAERWERMQEP